MSTRRSVAFGILAAVTLLAANLVQAAEPVVVAGLSSPNHPQQPQVVIDAGGVIHVAFGAKSGKSQGDIYYARSGDGGKSYSTPIKVGTVNGLALGMRRGPRIALSGDAVCISVIGHKDGNIFLFRSIDAGKTWEEAATINDERGSASEGLHAMAASPKGELTCVWLDHRHKKSEVFSSTSTDGGKTWSQNVLAYHSPDGDVCPCCHPSVAYSPDGKIHALWRNALGGSRDMYQAVSSDGGKTFAKAQKLGAGTWPLDSCPMDGGSIAVLSNGKPATVWRRDKTVYYFGPGSSQETELGPGEQPWLAASSKGPIAVWLRKRGESLLLRLPGAKVPVELSKAAGDPIVASGGAKNEIVVAAWEDTSGGVKKIVCQRIELTR
ncbi:MAG: sialidase family protein [Pirellulaceae bacterium]